PVEIAALAREDVDQALEAQIVAVTKRAALAERKGVEQRREPGVVLGLAADVELHVADDHGRARVDRHAYLPTIVPGGLERRVDRRVVVAERLERGAQPLRQLIGVAAYRLPRGVARWIVEKLAHVLEQLALDARDRDARRRGARERGERGGEEGARGHGWRALEQHPCHARPAHRGLSVLATARRKFWRLRLNGGR